MGLNVEKMLEGICKPVPLGEKKNEESNSSLLTVDEFVQKWNEKKVSQYYKTSSNTGGDESSDLSKEEMEQKLTEYKDACSLVDKFVQDYNKANRVGLYKDDKDDSKMKEESITAFGVTREEFERIYQENNGFDVKEPENNIKPVSDNFSDIMIRASKGYSETMRKQDQAGTARTRNKEQETNSDNK